MSTRKSLFALSIAILASSAFAKGYSPAVTAVPGGYGIKYSANGTPMAVPPSMLPSGSVGVTSPVNVALPGGINYPAIATAAIAAGAMLSPWASAIGVAVAAGSIGYAALDAALAQAKLRVKPGGGGMQQPDPSACSIGPCYFWWGRGPTPFNTAAAACSSRSDGQPSTGAWLKVTASPQAGASCHVSYVWQNRTPPSTADDSEFTFVQSPAGERDVDASAFVDTPIQNAAQIMAARSPSQAEVQALVDLGFPPVLAPPIITGPPSVSKQNIVMLGIDGTTTEIEERYIASFNPGIIGIGVETKQTVTTPEKKSTTTSTNADGSKVESVTTTPKTSTTISTTTAEIPKPATEDPPLDTGLPEQMKLYEPKYPDGLVGVWAVNKASMAATPLANLIGSLMPSVGSGGACPTMNVNLNYSSWANFGTHDFAPPCAIWEFGKWVIIFSALLLARSLVFGG